MTHANGVRVALALLALACGGVDSDVAVVTDASGLLAPSQLREISRHHDVLLRDHDIDYRVDVVPTVGDLLAYGVRRFDALGVGSRSGSGRGLLLVLDPTADRVRIEVGQNLEGIYTDAFVAYLEQRQMVPFFRAGRIADGILATTELVVTRAQDAARSAAFRPPTRAGAAGGGAAARAQLGAGLERGAGPDVVARQSPDATVAVYLDAMRGRNGNPGLDVYSTGSREMLADWVMTPAQMDAIARAYARCRAEAPRLDDTGRRAVIRYPVDDRACAPWFLVAEQGRWRLDLATAQHVVRFGAGNAWHFAPGVDHPYAFAFADWRFDGHGFPHAR